MKNLPARQDPVIGGRFALVELLRNGCTTVVEIGTAAEEHAAIVGELGMRAYLSPAYKSYDYRVGPHGELSYELHEEAGLRALERAQDFIRRHHGAQSGRMQGMLFPFQVETCSPALLRATRKAANELGVGIEIHAGQNLLEFHEILRRHCQTPIEYLADTGLLGPDAIVGHCIINSAHRLAGLPGGRDLEILAASGASVAHCPLVFARRGNALESFHRFRAAGINVGLGTDTYPARPHQRDAAGRAPVQGGRARLHGGHLRRRVLCRHAWAGPRPCVATIWDAWPPAPRPTSC